jgi:hypothetical protein
LTIGSRFCLEKVTVPRYRQFGIKVITWLFNFGCRTKITDSQSGFRAYKSNIYKNFHLSEKGMCISIETLETARWEKAVIEEVPIDCIYHNSRITFNDIKHGLTVALSVIKIRLKQSLYCEEKVENPPCQ